MSCAPTSGVPAERWRTWGMLKSGDFEAVLTTAPLARSTHFVIQYMPDQPASAIKATSPRRVLKLSTDRAPRAADSVDNVPGRDTKWLGLIVPKRHAKRAVTRNLLKRQMRTAIARHELRMRPGQWVVRLRAPFDGRMFPSAASEALRKAATGELEQLFARAVAE